MRNLAKAILAGAVFVGAEALADAGPNFIESALCQFNDAGSLPGNACSVTGLGTVLSIAGSTALGFLPGPSEDMYLIDINDAKAFTAITEATFDARLYPH